MNKIPKKKKLVGGIEPQFYEELCSIVAQAPYPNHAPHKITQPHIQHQTINFYHHLYATTSNIPLLQSNHGCHPPKMLLLSCYSLKSIFFLQLTCGSFFPPRQSGKETKTWGHWHTNNLRNPTFLGVESDL